MSHSKLKNLVQQLNNSYLECLEVAGVDSGLWMAVSCDIVDVPSPDTVDASESKLADDPAPFTKPARQFINFI